jgi:hypothetical protein
MSNTARPRFMPRATSCSSTAATTTPPTATTARPSSTNSTGRSISSTSRPKGNQRPALWVVEDDGSERKMSFAEMAARSNQVANWLRDCRACGAATACC